MFGSSFRRSYGNNDTIQNDSLRSGDVKGMWKIGWLEILQRRASIQITPLTRPLVYCIRCIIYKAYCLLYKVYCLPDPHCITQNLSRRVIVFYLRPIIYQVYCLLLRSYLVPTRPLVYCTSLLPTYAYWLLLRSYLVPTRPLVCCTSSIIYTINRERKS